MGKGARLKAARAGMRATRSQKALEEARQPLIRAAQVVTLLFGDTPDCAGAAALLAAIGDELGSPLRARPVSVIGTDAETNDTFFMGPKARARFSDEALAAIEDHRKNGRDTGHIVVTSDDALLLLDPNLTQVRSYGMNAPGVAMRIRSTDPESGEWDVVFGSLHLHYMLDEDNRSLIPRFERQRRVSQVMAKAISHDIRAGLPPKEIAANIAQ